MPPQILLRAADSRPYELHDLLPSDARFKVLVFTGNISRPTQLSKVEALAQEMGGANGFLRRFGRARSRVGDTAFSAAFDVISISSARKTDVRYTVLPMLFRSHWSKCVSYFLFLSPLLLVEFIVCVERLLMMSMLRENGEARLMRVLVLTN